MIRKIFFLGFVFVLMAFTWHKYYVSITEINYNKSDKKLEISIKLIGHDLEHILTYNGVPNLYLGTENEDKKANTYILDYIKKEFSITIDDKKINYTFIGKEVNNDDFIYCYLETDTITNFKKIFLKNSLLTEKFPAQENIVYLNIGEQKFYDRLNAQIINETHDIKSIN